ncbi:FMN-binding negative transcriptional regulator [Sporosarcina sp. FA9]|uniref:FMN-binding negative transcriptional regulator n=1 Tax=Sporosarcina sp. FA9 TaxID=3413030 RepID=UPI003F65735F
MYIPKDFQMTEEQMKFEHIEKNSFATLISQHRGSPYATHLPVLLAKDKTYLYGHFARPNEQWKDIEDQEILVIFQSPHCYISPSWYESTNAVPTWNYTAVHVYGKMELMDDDKELLKSLENMVMKYERPNSSYNLDDMNDKIISGMAKGIVGFRIKIEKIEGKAKLSQNHPVGRQHLVIQQLEKLKENERKIASLMKENSMHST